MADPRPARAARAALVLLLALPLAAAAHTGADAGQHHGWLAGFRHPLTGADHLCAMLGIGLWSALSARRAWPDLFWAPAAFAALLLAGALLGMGGSALPAVEPMIAASLLVIGLLALTQWRLPAPAAVAVAGAFALFHGMAHGFELAGDGGAWTVLAGMLTATVLLHGTGMALGWALRPARRWLPRLAGGAVALFGLVLLARLA